jgi:arginyl-tRNA synthetase
MRIEKKLQAEVLSAIKNIYNNEADSGKIQFQKTRKEFQGDYTLVVFLLLAYSKKSPEQTASDIGEYLKNNVKEVADFNVVKGFLNITLTPEFWISFFREIYSEADFGTKKADEKSKKIVIEFSSPNTNKPLHLGHIRNNLIGHSVSQILRACGNDVIQVNLVNDRGIHICKSMVAWEERAGGETPQQAGIKGDRFVGNYYVLFDQEYKKQIAELVAGGMSEEQAKEDADWMKKARFMLKKWERGNQNVIDTWKTMNGWVYEGFEKTYAALGIRFDKIYYESQTYLNGKSIVLKGLKQGDLKQKPDGTVFLDLSEYAMDEKVLLRADGTSVYMTQDIGTAVVRYEDFKFDEAIYVVGNEQDYHFKVLSIVLDKLEFPWSNRLTHLSYGMVELPEGKMKSREGTVVDADDLIDEMIQTARTNSEELGKLEGFSGEETEKIHKIIALGALKYFILKVDSKKNITFNPKESIDFNGNTGPFIQYTGARINSLLKKVQEENISKDLNFNSENISSVEIALMKMIYEFPAVVEEAGDKRNPAEIANYSYELAKEFNRLYQDLPILKEENSELKNLRIALAEKTGTILKTSLSLLGIEVPERM